ncbi:FRG domain-containing protein [Streptomyces sp. SID13588]|uniref:FRG domain-containing protein n=1 Tax=Streptomyces sp. SID13588 TaxID=2706051 RepID=UPI0013CA9FD2|nr:FRG domain-containing protein [Streptomyces sp. SID13588]NEA72587.1 FRG domain-containing protein [Streptomyces sp. SID13588]
MDPSSSIASILARSLNPPMLAASAARIADPLAMKDALSLSNFLCFRASGLTPREAGEVSLLLEAGLASLQLNGDLLSAALQLANNLNDDQRQSAVDWISAWRFLGHPSTEAVPPHAPPDTIAIVRTEDAMCDILIQPIEVLQSHIQAFITTWSAARDAKISTIPQIRSWDPALATIECRIAQVMGFDFAPTIAPPSRTFRRPGVATYGGRRPIKNRPRSHPSSGCGQAVDAMLRRGELVQIPPDQIPWEENLEPIFDEVYSVHQHPDDSYDPTLMVDPFYGQVYQRSTLEHEHGAYGITADLAAQAAMQLSNYGTLRVPFRAIPRIFVNTSSEFALALESIMRGTAPLGVTSLLFRGQTREHTLGRSKDLLEHFYGDPDVIEPSLLSSGDRRRGRHPSLMAAWGATVEAFAIWNGHTPKNSDEISAFSRREGDLIKLALAQHYGLPTPALDVTRNPRVALWFALHKLIPQGSGLLQIEPMPANEVAVLYVLDAPEVSFSGELSDIPTVRPSRQEGYFVAGSWGFRRNRVARYLLGAIYFKGSIAGDFSGMLPTGEYLFPEDDAMVHAVREVKRINHSRNLVANELSDHLYVVK